MKTACYSTQRCGKVLRVLLASVLIVLPGALSAQWGKAKEKDKNEELGPVGRTEEIINVMWTDLSVPLDQFSFFHAGRLGIYTGEPYYDQRRIIMLPAGEYSFLVSPGLVVDHGSRFAYEAPDNAIRVDCTLEPGKAYTFMHDKVSSLIGIGNATNVSVVDLNFVDSDGGDAAERIAENFRKFVEYYTADPLALEGTYVSKNGKESITFAGDRFSAVVRFSQQNFIYEGTFRFNEDTIIACVESQTQDFGKRRKTDLGAHEIWLYKKEGDTLEILGKSYNVMMGLNPLRGTYTKTAE